VNHGETPRFYPGCRVLNTKALAVLAAAVLSAASADAQQRTIDPGKSVMTVHVYKAGILSAFGHDHEIAAPIAAGTADLAAPRVALSIRASALRVNDADASDKDRAEIQKTMLGPDVLDVERFPEISFKSTAVEAAGAGAWKITGDLILRGQTRPVTLEVRDTNGHYVGTARFKQTGFGIKPVRVAGGAVRVKDEVQVKFDIQLVN